MTEDRALPAPPVRTVYLDTGEEVAEFTGGDFGNQPDWDKDQLLGKGIVIRGLSTEVFEQEPFPPARSVLYNAIDTDDADTDPWGMFFSDCGDTDTRTSTVIKQIRSEFRKNGGKPFLATLEKVSSESHKGQTYYKLVRYIRNATPKDVASTANRQK